MNRLHTKTLVYVLLLINASYTMSMDKTTLTTERVEAIIASLKQNKITNPIAPIHNFQNAKKFAGHVILYEITSKDTNRFSGDALSQYGFIFEKIHLLPSCFGYELNQFSDPNKPIQLNFSCNSGDYPNSHLLLSSVHIFMRHLTPQEAAGFSKKIKSGDITCDEKTRYSQAILARLKYRAQQEADETPSLHVITKKNLKKLSSLTPEQAEEILKDVREADFFDYYVSDEEQHYIENLLQSIVDQKK